MQPSIGRIVHYLEGEGQTAVALIVDVHPEREPQARLVSIDLASAITDVDGNFINADGTPYVAEVAVDSDGNPIYEGGTAEGDVALHVFRPDGVVYHVPVASEHHPLDRAEDADDDAEDEPDVQPVGTWTWPPRV